jgi:kinesin family protein 2/24
MNYQDTPKIRVVIRKRPLNKKETARNDTDIINVISKDQMIVREEKVKVDLTKFIEETNFKFDAVFD